MSVKEQLQNAGIGFVTGAASDALGLIKGGAETKRNIRAAKELAVFNRQQQMQLWRDTNYAAQVKEAEKAGLSVGLLYGKGGSGGSVNLSTSGNVGSNATSSAVQAMGIATQNALIAAQKENIEADTEKKKIEAAKMAGADTENVEASTEKLKTETTKMLQETKNLEEQEKAIKATVQQIYASTTATETEIQLKLQQIRSAIVEADISEATKKDVIAQAGLETIRKELENALTKENISIAQYQQKKIIEEIANLSLYPLIEGTKLNLQDAQIKVNEALGKLGIEQKYSANVLSAVWKIADIITNGDELKTRR